MSNECRYCQAWVRWSKATGKWKPYGADDKVHNCAARWKAVKAKHERDLQARPTDAKKAAANDVPEKETA